MARRSTFESQQPYEEYDPEARDLATIDAEATDNDDIDVADDIVHLPEVIHRLRQEKTTVQKIKEFKHSEAEVSAHRYDGERTALRENTERDAIQENIAQDKKERQEHTEYEINRGIVFDRFSKLENKVKELRSTLPEVLQSVVHLTAQLKDAERTKNETLYNELEPRLRSAEKEAQLQGRMLPQNEQIVHAGRKFETNLWGNNPTEQKANARKMFVDIKSIATCADVLNFFDSWGALPGKDSQAKPQTDRGAVEHFLQEMHSLSPEERESQSIALFPQEGMRKMVLGIKVAPKAESAPEVLLETSNPKSPWAPKERVTLLDKKHQADSQIAGLRKEIQELEVSPNKYPVSQDVLIDALEQKLRSAEREKIQVNSEIKNEIYATLDKRNSLKEAREVINSKLFQYAPFLMRFTKKGREQLEVLKNAGLDKSAIGASNGNISLALALRLKSLREEAAVLVERVNTSFLHDAEARVDSQGFRREAIMTKNDGEVQRDEAALRLNPKKRTARRITGSLERMTGKKIVRRPKKDSSEINP